MCLCNDDLAHVINQSAIISFFFFSFCFFSSKLGTRFESLAKQSSRSPYIFSFSFIFHFAPFFLFFGTRLKENNYTYILRASMYLCDSIIPSVPLSPSLFSIFRVLFPIPRFVHYVPFSLREYPFVSPSFLSHTHTHANTHAHTHAYKHTSAHTHTVSLFFSPFLFLSCFFLSFFFTLLLNRYRKICRWESSRGRPKSRSSLFFSFISPRALQTRELKGPFFFILYSLFFSLLFFLPLIPRPAGSRARALQYPIKTKLFLSWLPCVTVKVGRPTRIVVDHAPPSSSKRADPRSIDRKFQPSNHFLSLCEPFSSLLSTPRIAVPAFLIGIF